MWNWVSRSIREGWYVVNFVCEIYVLLHWADSDASEITYLVIGKCWFSGYVETGGLLVSLKTLEVGVRCDRSFLVS